MRRPAATLRSLRPGLAALAVLVVLAAAALGWRAWSGRGAAAPTSSARLNLVIVTIDTLRADRTGGRLTPALNALAARGARFLDARSPVPLTLPAHASLMTGLLPPRHGVRLNGAHRLSPTVVTLASRMQQAGYTTAAFIGAYVLDSRFGLSQGFGTYDADIPRRDAVSGELEAERRGEVVVDRAIRWLNALKPDAPFFLWAHLYDPHAPYSPPPGWTERAGGHPYDGEVAYADAQLGRLLDALSASHIAARTVVVVCGDHGESLGDHGEPTHGLLVYEKAVDVPLVLAGPGITRSERRDAVSLVDVVPTVLGLFGLPSPRDVDGRNLFAAGAERADAETYLETEYPRASGFAALRAVVAGRWKYIGGARPGELYDLAADPGEASDVAAAHNPTAEAMDARTRAIASRAGPSQAAAPSAEAAERLRALGYVASSAPAAGDAEAPSPRRLVEVWPRFQAAVGDLAGGRANLAVPVLSALSREFPASVLFASSYARGLDEAGRPRDALRVYRAAAARWPTDTTLLQGQATAARNAGLPDQAMQAHRAVLALDPTDAAAENGIGLLLADAGRPAEARDAFRKAVALDAHVVSYWNNLGNACRAASLASEAEEAYRRALALDEGSLDAMNGIGVLLVQGNRSRQAAEWFERAVTRAPDFYEAWLNLGIARQEQGDTTAAADAYRRVLAAPARYGQQRAAARQLLASLPVH